MSVILMCFAPEDLGREQVARVEALGMRVVTRDPAAMEVCCRRWRWRPAGWRRSCSPARRACAGCSSGARAPTAAAAPPGGRRAALRADKRLGRARGADRRRNHRSGAHVRARAAANGGAGAGAARVVAAGAAGRLELRAGPCCWWGWGRSTSTAALASALGMRVEGVRRDPSVGAPGVAAMYGPGQLRERLPHADVVVLTVPLSRETRGLIGAEELALMRPSAYLVPISAGAGRWTRVRWRRRWARGAWRARRWTCSPRSPCRRHRRCGTRSAASSRPTTPASPRPTTSGAMAIFLDNLRRFLAGEELCNVVDKQAGY